MMSTPRFRCYRTNDVTGVELGGALKNVLAIGGQWCWVGRGGSRSLPPTCGVVSLSPSKPSLAMPPWPKLQPAASLMAWALAPMDAPRSLPEAWTSSRAWLVGRAGT